MGLRFPLIVALLRLYPSRWRTEYGDELALLLARRPLGPGAILNVIAGAMWQHIRTQPPWRIVAAPLLLWMCVHIMLSYISPGAGRVPPIAAVPILFGVGFWTTWRSQAGGGAAAAKLSAVLTVPLILAGVTNAIWISLAPPPLSATPGIDIDPQNLAGPFLYLPYAPIFGWIGGLAARGIRRNRAIR